MALQVCTALHFDCDCVSIARIASARASLLSIRSSRNSSPPHKASKQAFCTNKCALKTTDKDFYYISSKQLLCDTYIFIPHQQTQQQAQKQARLGMRRGICTQAYIAPSKGSSTTTTTTTITTQERKKEAMKNVSKQEKATKKNKFSSSNVLSSFGSSSAKV